MRPILIPALAAALALAAPALAESEAAPGFITGYAASELLSPCQEADNDARWGEAAEIECEQYLIGFVSALQITGGTGQEAGICLPEENIADEVRWAFMRWVHQSYSKRTAVPAAEAVMATLTSAFPCN